MCLKKSIDFVESRCREALLHRKKQKRLRVLPPKIEGIDFFSNDYLGLARNRELQREISVRWAAQSGNGATGARLLSATVSLQRSSRKNWLTFLAQRQLYSSVQAIWLFLRYFLLYLSEVISLYTMLTYMLVQKMQYDSREQSTVAFHTTILKRLLVSLDEQRTEKCFVLSEGLFLWKAIYLL